MIKSIARLVIALNANTRPVEIAAGAGFGLLLALVPGGNLLWIALFILTFFLKINMAMQFLVMGLARLVVPLADPALDRLGWAVLTAPACSRSSPRCSGCPSCRGPGSMTPWSWAACSRGSPCGRPRSWCSSSS